MNKTYFSAFAGWIKGNLLNGFAYNRHIGSDSVKDPFMEIFSSTPLNPTSELTIIVTLPLI